MGDYIALDQPEKANDIFDQARKRKLDHNYLGLYRYYTAFLQGDTGAMQEHLEFAMGRPGAQDALFSAQADTEAFYGRLERAGISHSEQCIRRRKPVHRRLRRGGRPMRRSMKRKSGTKLKRVALLLTFWG